MQQPAIFREDDPATLHTLMRAHPFATLITAALGPLEADHVPLVLHETPDGLRLRGHLAVTNPLARSGVEATDALCVFQGPHAYISPGWYASKREHGRAVPTWNYAVVHARGSLRVVRDADWLLAHLHALTEQHESHRAEPWALGDAPADYLARLKREIVGLELEVAALSGVWKMSQNKSHADRAGVRAGLSLDSVTHAADVSALVPQHGD